MSEMVERVARAILPHIGNLSPYDPYEIARAAMAAMREPDKDMLAAAVADPVTKAVDGLIGLAAAHSARLPERYSSPDNTPILCWWRAMIDKALE